MTGQLDHGLLDSGRLDNDQTPMPLAEPAASNGTSGGGRRTAPSIDDRLASRRRRWPVLVAGVALGAGGALAVDAVRGDSPDATPAVDPTETVALATVAVEVRDLIEEVEWDGTIAAGTTSTVASPAAGTVTAVVGEGETVGRGDVVARIDDHPVVALFGDVPIWRDLDVGAEGADVAQLEANLSLLGFDPDGVITIDTEYTAATADMVEAWQEALGVEATGEVAMRDVVILSGEATAASPALVGTSIQVGQALITAEQSSVGFDVVAAAWDPDLSPATDDDAADDTTAATTGDAAGDDDDADGVLTAVVEPGTVVEHGTVLYTIDDVDAVAVIELTPATVAVLAAISDADVELLETELSDHGFDPGATIDIDDDVDEATTSAIRRWQEAAGLAVTGSVQATSYVVVPDDREYVVADPSEQMIGEAVGQPVGEGQVVARLVSPTLELTADVSVAEIDEFEVGDVVQVEQLDESTFVAAVAEIATTAAGEVGDATVSVTFEIVEPPDEFVNGAVTITSESSRIDDALVVPTRALVSLREGGFAVEVADDDGGRRLVGVELGTFSDGVVEIVEVVAGDLAAGDLVVVPS